MTTTTKKRDYLWMLDVLPALALGQFCSKWLLTVFHGSPEATVWLSSISYLLGVGVGTVLSYYIRMQVTNIIQNRRTAFIVSLFISLLLTLAIIVVTVLIEKSAAQNKNFVAQDRNSVGMLLNPARITAELVGTWDCRPLDERSGNGVSTFVYKADGTLDGSPWYVGDDLRLYEKNPFSARADGYMQVNLEWVNGNFVRTVTDTGIRLFCEKRRR